MNWKIPEPKAGETQNTVVTVVTSQTRDGDWYHSAVDNDNITF